MAFKAVLSNIWNNSHHLGLERTFAQAVNNKFRDFNYNSRKKNEEKNEFISKQDEIISTAIKNYDGRVTTNWDILKTKVFQNGRTINEINFDAKVIAFCTSHRNMAAAKSYLNYIYSKDKKPNIATLGRMLRLYYLCNENKAVSEEDEKSILHIYEQLTESCSMFDSMTAEYVITALSLTKEWKKCINLLDTVKFTGTPSAITYSSIARAAFLNKEEKVGLQLLDEALAINKSPYPNVYNGWLTMAAKDKNNTLNKVNELLNFWENHEIQPSKDVTFELIRKMQPFKYSGIYTTIDNKGVCKSCQCKLEQAKVDEKEFETLKSAFFYNVVVGKNVFNKTTPEELDRFRKFIANGGRYDMIIDGLNVAYSVGQQTPQTHSKILLSVVNHFVEKSKKVLVLGRIHMNKWPKMDKIRSKADIFLAQNISQDDPYILYATMASGLGTGFFSRDFMRSHSYLLMDQHLRRIFRRWQQLHQHSLIHVEPNGKCHIKYPHKSVPTVQKHNNGWHIPYVMEFMLQPPSTLDPPKNWLCITKG